MSSGLRSFVLSPFFFASEFNCLIKKVKKNPANFSFKSHVLIIYAPPEGQASLDLMVLTVTENMKSDECSDQKTVRLLTMQIYGVTISLLILGTGKQ